MERERGRGGGYGPAESPAMRRILGMSSKVPGSAGLTTSCSRAWRRCLETDVMLGFLRALRNSFIEYFASFNRYSCCKYCKAVCTWVFYFQAWNPAVGSYHDIIFECSSPIRGTPARIPSLKE